MKLPTIRVWTSVATCLAMVLTFAGIAAAQNEQDQRNQDQQQQSSDQSDRDRDSDRDRQDRDRDGQNQQRDQEQRQREQQERQRQQQEQQRDQQNQQYLQDRERGQQTQWDETRTRQNGQRDSTNWPQPTQYEYGRQQQTQYDNYGQRQSTQFDRQRDEHDAGLGVNIISEGGLGVVVARVFRGTPAEEMGLQQRDRITHINGQQIRSVDDFINRIRNMNPGDAVELEVLRDRAERIVRGELESRQDALVLSNRRQSGQSWQQGDPNWQTGYQEGGYGYQQQAGTTGGDFNSRINSIEQQVSRLSRELEQIRYALQDLRQGGQSGQMTRRERTGETQAGYYDESGRFQDGRFSTGNRDGQSNRFGEFRSDGTWQGDTFRDGGQGQRFQGSGQSSEFGRSSSGQSSTEGGSDSDGGVTGSLRTRPQSDQNWSDRQ